MKSCHEIAHHVEKLVSKFSRCKRLQELDNANKQHANRELHCSFDDDGSVIIRGRLPAEQGALIMKALELAMDRAGSSVGARIAAKSAPNDVTAETSELEPFHTRRADALAEIAETYLNSEPGDASTADRYQVVVHVTAETLDSVQSADVVESCAVESCAVGACTAGDSYLDDGPPRYRGNIAPYCL